MSKLEIPAADAGDSDDVIVALETARSELEGGALAGAAEWLRRAVTAAVEQGRLDRSLVLTQALTAFGEGRFTPVEEGDVILSDIDEFSDETIVDDAPKLPPQLPRQNQPPRQNEAAPRQNEPAQRKRPTAQVTKIATSPTPVAQAPRPSKGPPTYGAVRVSVRRALGGKWEVRPLGERESAPSGEEEALLVPLRPGAKFA